MAVNAFALAGEWLRRGPVLDVGCGTGWWLERLAAEGVEPMSLHGIDIQPSRVRATAARVPGATVGEADARRLPYADGTFRAVTLFLTLSSLADRRSLAAALTEAGRVSASDGCVVIWDVRVANPFNPLTHRIRRDAVAAHVGTPVRTTTLTLLPPLARRLGATSYARLSAVRLLHTHRLSVHRPALRQRSKGHVVGA